MCLDVGVVLTVPVQGGSVCGQLAGVSGWTGSCIIIMSGCLRVLPAGCARPQVRLQPATAQTKAHLLWLGGGANQPLMVPDGRQPFMERLFIANVKFNYSDKKCEVALGTCGQRGDGFSARLATPLSEKTRLKMQMKAVKFTMQIYHFIKVYLKVFIFQIQGVARH